MFDILIVVCNNYYFLHDNTESQKHFLPLDFILSVPLYLLDLNIISHIILGNYFLFNGTNIHY